MHWSADVEKNVDFSKKKTPFCHEKSALRD